MVWISRRSLGYARANACFVSPSEMSDVSRAIPGKRVVQDRVSHVRVASLLCQGLLYR